MPAWARVGRIGDALSRWRRAVVAAAQHPSFYPAMLMLVLVVGGVLRFTGLNWDQGHGIHPDERFLRMVESDIKWPKSISEYFNSDVSKLNPRNVGHGFWVYGELPLIIVNRLGALLHRQGYDGIQNVGRFASGLFDLMGVLALYFLGKRLFSRGVGLLAAALMAFSVLDIQLSHFFAVDTFGAFFVILAMLCAVLVAEQGRWWHFVALGLATAAAVASKISLGVFGAIVALAWLIYTVRVVQASPQRGPAVERAVVRGLVLAFAFVIAFRVFQPYAFKGPSFFNFALSEKFLANMKEAGAYQTGQADPPWGFQWASRTPYLFPGYNIALFGLGVPLALAALGGWLVSAYELVRKRQWTKALPWVWVTLLFGYQGMQFVKSMRYFIPIYPFLALLAAYFLFRTYRWARQRSSPAALAALLIGGLVVLSTAFYAFAFLRVYITDHPRIAASGWIYENLPAAATLHYRTPTGMGQAQLNIPHNQQFGPGAPATQFQFRLPEDGELVGLTFNRLRDANPAPGPTSLRVSIVRASDPNDVLATSALTGLFAAGPDGKGLPYTLDLSGAVLAEGVPYAVTVVVESGDPLIAESSTILEETYDDPKVPFSFEGRDPFRVYDIPELRAYDDDNPQKLAHFQEMLGKADYIAFTSQRGYASLPRMSGRFPMAEKFYDLLFAGQLGFQLVAQFTDYPGIGPITFNDDNSEEAFTVYDHAKVLIFQKTQQLAPERIAELISPPDWTAIPRYTALQAASWKNVTLMLSPDELQTQRAGGTWSQIFDRDGWVNRVPVLVWMLFVELLGIVAFPFCFLAFRRLSERGYAFAKPMGVLLLAFLSWISVSLKLVHFTRTTIGLALLTLAIVGAAIAYWRRSEFVPFVKAHWRRLLVMDGLFVGLFCALLLVRLGNPDLWHPSMGGEKPMDFAYLNAIIKSTTFPPYDPWFSGGYLNYYYFGQVMMATLVKFLGIVPSLAYNLTLPLLFGMTAIAAFGVVVNLLPARVRSGDRWAPRVWLYGLAGSAVVAVLGNLGELQLILQGLTQLGGPGFPSKIPGLVGLVTAVKGLFKVIGGARLPFRPEWWYWNATRVIPETINEFPFFSLLYADLHAHVLALPFTVVAAGLATNLVRGASDALAVAPAWLSRLPGRIAGFTRRLWQTVGSWDLASLLALALVLGALRITNTWDLPTYLLLAGGAFAIRTYVRRKRVDWKGVMELLVVLVGLYVVSTLLYQPFHSKYGAYYTGIDRWKGVHTHILDFLIVAGLPLFLLASYLVTLAFGRRWRQGPLGWLGFAAANRYRLDRVWRTTRALSPRFGSWRPALLAGVAVVALAMVLLFALKLSLVAVLLPLIVLAAVLALRRRMAAETRFLVFVILLGLGVYAGTEVVVIKGDIGRMNTVFKFYLQVWILWGIAAVVCLASLAGQLSHWKVSWQRVWNGVLAFLVFSAALYPAFATKAKINDRYDPTRGPSLDGMAYMEKAMWSENDHNFELKWDRDAINWMLDNIQGSPVVAEANQSGIQYHWYSRISIYTGLPTIVGWQWHQMQQRAVIGQGPLDRRQEDLKALYETRDEQAMWEVVGKYDVRYIYVGDLERAVYPAEGLTKFERLSDAGQLRVAYQNEHVTLYEVMPQ